MDGFEYYRELVTSAQYIDEILPIFRPLTRSPETRDLVRRLIAEMVSENLSELRGSPNEWFNLIAHASQVDYTTAERTLFEAALRAHPSDVDLLCQWFQFQYGHGTTDDALAVWQHIESLGEEETAPFWRYWVYRAMFLSNFMYDKNQAVAFLDRAQEYVVPEGLLHVFRQYRVVLIDGGMKPSTSTNTSMNDYDALADKVESRFREGLHLGIENGYVLANELARLLRERSAGKSREEADRVLDEALELLDLAERTYTRSPNHPIEDIYIEKAVTFMARRRYADALQIFRSLPPYRLDESMRVMARYAANMTGQTFEAEAPAPAAEIENLENRLSRLENLLASLLGGNAEAVSRQLGGMAHE